MALMAVNNEEAGDFRSKPRWSAGGKMDVVLRLLRGEKLEELSRELGVESPSSKNVGRRRRGPGVAPSMRMATDDRFEAAWKLLLLLHLRPGEVLEDHDARGVTF
jgi:hypothetical protein